MTARELYLCAVASVVGIVAGFGAVFGARDLRWRLRQVRRGWEIDTRRPKR